MSILSHSNESRFFNIAGSLIAILAITSSFLGYYFGVKESAKNLIATFLYKNTSNEKETFINKRRTTIIINLYLGLFLWVVAIFNFNIANLLGIMCAPIIASILYFTPYLILKYIPKYHNYRGMTYRLMLFGGVAVVLSYPLAKILTIIR